MLKKFDESGFISADNRDVFPLNDMPREAIRYQQGEHQTTIYYPNGSTNPLIKKLDLEIIKITKIDKWIPKIKLHGCYPPNTRLGFYYKDLKTEQ
ncbi:MAG: hypothetical protein HOP36_15970 [Methyloglobulus sp.]|nr:hypothetical protein [Methyloglobulus sp.]